MISGKNEKKNFVANSVSGAGWSMASAHQRPPPGPRLQSGPRPLLRSRPHRAPQALPSQPTQAGTPGVPTGSGRSSNSAKWPCRSPVHCAGSACCLRLVCVSLPCARSPSLPSFLLRFGPTAHLHACQHVMRDCATCMRACVRAKEGAHNTHTNTHMDMRMDIIYMMVCVCVCVRVLVCVCVYVVRVCV